MPIYMDLHIVPGVNAKAVAEAHSRDVYLEKDHNCKCLTYWIDELRGHVFCLIDAPNKETVYELHNRSHGLLPHKIIEVQNDFVESFLGRITDPDSGLYTETGLLMLNDSSYRILMSVCKTDSALLSHLLGAESSIEKLKEQTVIIKNEIVKYNGKEVQHTGHDILGSFVSAEAAVKCALAIQDQLSAIVDEFLSIRIDAGEPVANNNELFGETLRALDAFQLLNSKNSIIISGKVKELINVDLLQNSKLRMIELNFNDEQLLKTLLDVLEENFSNNEFGADKYAQKLAMSKSQLYRKIKTLTGNSPNDILKFYRLENAKKLLRKKYCSIFEVALQTGFTSPSYFTKCFKGTFDLLPLTYQQLV